MVLISQSEVLEFLEKHPKEWFTTKEISEKIGITHGSCINNMTRLRKHNLAVRRESGKRYCYEYKFPFIKA